MERASQIISIWAARHEAHVTVQGVGDADLTVHLAQVLEELLHAGARHLVVDLHRLRGDDTGALELLAATCHRLWNSHGLVDVVGMRDRLISRPEVRAFPEVFGALRPEAAAPTARLPEVEAV